MDENFIDEALISEVQKFEFLYNKSAGGYSNRSLRDRTWQKIGQALNQPAIDCQHKWKTLRDRFTRESKKLDQPSGSAARKSCGWDLYPSLGFLKRHMQPRSTITNCVDDVDDLDSTTSTTSFTPQAELDDSNFESEIEVEPMKKRTKNAVNEMFIDTLKSFNTVLSAKTTAKTTDSFGQTLSEILNTLSPKTKVKAKLNILGYLTRLQESDDANVESEFFY